MQVAFKEIIYDQINKDYFRKHYQSSWLHYIFKLEWAKHHIQLKRWNRNRQEWRSKCFSILDFAYSMDRQGLVVSPVESMPILPFSS